jgi:DNA-binding IclR family transcriptional regulator
MCSIGEQAEAYGRAQRAIADLKTSILQVLSVSGSKGLRNADIGHALGVNMGHSGSGRHEGHISMTLLQIMQEEGVVERDTDSKRWRLKQRELFAGLNREAAE